MPMARHTVMEQTEECCVPILDKELLHGNIRHEQEKNNELFKDYPDVITILELQTMLNIGRNVAYRLLQDKTIASIRVGKKYIIPKASVEKFITEGIQK